MEKKIKIMYYRDCGLVISFIILLWVVLLGAISVFFSLGANLVMHLLILSIGLITGIFATTALIAVLGHLKKKGRQIYTAEILPNIQDKDPILPIVDWRTKI